MSDQSASGNICHILPCSIDEDITAPIGQYFKPTALPNEIYEKKKNDNDGAPEEDDDNNNKKNVTIMAAQFRGRGLLCAVDSPTSSSTDSGSSEEEDNNTTSSKPILSKLPSNIIGVALSAQSGTSNNNTSASSTNSKDPPMQPLKVVETFNEVYNWSHEHDVKKVMRERYGNDKYGLNAVLGWCDLSHEVSILYSCCICVVNGI